MRLIDAGKLKESIVKNKDDYDYMCQSCIEETETIVEEQPTAYDLNKVVESLEKELKLADDEKERCSRENQLQFDCAKGYAHGIAVAISIAKAGGMD